MRPGPRRLSGLVLSLVVLCGAAATGAPTASEARLKLEPTEPDRILQRTSDDSADLELRGTLSGEGVPIEARVVLDDDGAEVLPWAPLDSAPARGRFEGRVAGIPSGGWYRVEVRPTGAPDATVSTARFAVGAVIGIAGQSQIALWFLGMPEGGGPEPHPLVRMYRHDGYWWDVPGTGAWRPVTGAGAITFANAAREALGVPIGVLPYAVNGSALRRKNAMGSFPRKNGSPPTMGWWLDDDGRPRPKHNHFYALVQGIAGAEGIEALLWTQGHTDGMAGETAEAYADGLAQLFTSVRKATTQDLPVFLSLLPRETQVEGYEGIPAMTDEHALAIRAGQRAAAANDSRLVLAATTIDLPLAYDHVHLSIEGRMIHAQRMAAALGSVLNEGPPPHFRGPRLESFEAAGDGAVDVHIAHAAGKDFTPATDIVGFAVTGDGAGDVTSARRLDADTIRLTISGDTDAVDGVEYLLEANPGDLDVEELASAYVHDDSPLALPLEAGRLEAAAR